MKPYRATPDDTEHHGQVTEMFNRIAGRYDLLNRIMTGGLDICWRESAARKLDPQVHRRVIDVCCGTGDIALALHRRGHSVVGLDAAEEMLALARERHGGDGVVWLEGDAMSLPLPDDAVDALTIGFGIRNIADRVGALREFRRVVRPGGRLVVLEALPSESAIWRSLLAAYEAMAFPILGVIFGGDRRAYEYLAGSIAGFGTAGEFEVELLEAGWERPRTDRLIGDAVAVFTAETSMPD